MPTMSTSELTKLSHTLARALSVDQVNQLGRDTGLGSRLVGAESENGRYVDSGGR